MPYIPSFSGIVSINKWKYLKFYTKEDEYG